MSQLSHFREECLREINIRRAAHGVDKLNSSLTLDTSAQDWAKELVNMARVEYSPVSLRGEVGESISVRTTTGAHADMEASEVINQWYSDEKNYDYASGKGPAGNFTQLVWSSTREVGFGKCNNGGKCVVVAHFRPPGNISGHYLENVFRLKSSTETGQDGRKQEISKQSTDSSKTTVVETITEKDGKKYLVRKEVSESRDQTGKVQRSTNELYTDLGKSSTAVNNTGLRSDQNLHTEEEKEFIQSVIKLHNEYRDKHGAPHLELDEELSKMAQSWAENQVKQQHLSNSGSTYQGQRLGENVASRWSSGTIQYNSHQLIDPWYQESTNYDYDREPTSVQGVGNFTQLVWQNSKRLGVGVARDTSDKSTKLVLVCFYFPAGNVLRQFKANVKRPVS